VKNAIVEFIAINRRTPESSVNRIFLFIAHVVTPLLIGAWIYVAWRSPSLLVFDWLYLLHIDPTPIRASMAIPYIVEYCLPNGFWVYAGTSWMLLVWQHSTPWVYLYLVLGTGMEFGQLIGIVPGTFEWLDILACLLGFIVSYLVIQKCTKSISGRHLPCC